MNPKKTRKEVKAMKGVGEMRNWLHHLGRHYDERGDTQLKTTEKGESIMKRLERIGVVILVVMGILIVVIHEVNQLWCCAFVAE